MIQNLTRAPRGQDSERWQWTPQEKQGNGEWERQKQPWGKSVLNNPRSRLFTRTALWKRDIGRWTPIGFHPLSGINSLRRTCLLKLKRQLENCSIVGPVPNLKYTHIHKTLSPCCWQGSLVHKDNFLIHLEISWITRRPVNPDPRLSLPDLFPDELKNILHKDLMLSFIIVAQLEIAWQLKPTVPFGLNSWYKHVWKIAFKEKLTFQLKLTCSFIRQDTFQTKRFSLIAYENEETADIRPSFQHQDFWTVLSL